MCVCVGDDDEGNVFGLQCLGLFCVSVSTPQGGGREKYIRREEAGKAGRERGRERETLACLGERGGGR